MRNPGIAVVAVLFVAALLNCCGDSDNPAPDVSGVDFVQEPETLDIPDTPETRNIPETRETGNVDVPAVEVDSGPTRDDLNECFDALFEVGEPNINNRGADAVLAPSTQFSLKFDWKLSTTSDCDNCAKQLVIGIGDQAMVCVAVGIPEVCPGYTEDTFFGTLVAPDLPGDYVLFAAAVDDSDCIGYENVELDTKIGEIQVKEERPQDLPPVAEQLVVEEPVSGTVKLSFLLTDVDSDPCDVAVEFKVGNSGQYKSALLVGAGSSTEGLPSSPEGIEHSVHWNTMSQFGKVDKSNLFIRVAPSDKDGAGAAAELGPLTAENGPFELADETEARLPALTGDSRFAAHADFDGDGDEDLVVAIGGKTNVLLENDSKGYFTAHDLFGGGQETGCIAAAMIDSDEHPDLFVGNVNVDSLVLLNDGEGGFVDATAELLGAFSYQVERVLPADLDGDGDVDFVALCSGSQQERLLVNDGTGKLSDLTLSHMPQDTLMAASGSLGSVDGEGPPDLAFANFISSQTTRLWLNDGSGHFSDQSGKLGAGYESMGFDALLTDLNGDGFADLFEANLMNFQRVLLNDGEGNFTELPGAVPSNLGFGGDGVLMGADVEAGDLDLDGNNDIFLSCSGTTPGFNTNVLLLGAGTGGLVDYAGYSFAENAADTRHSTMLDVDGDGDLEIFVVNSFSQSRLFFNK